uniref:(E,E)-germacrene B synthase-like n=1 Tax=Nicotiana tabacum TaxID=4097 RepID=A0A1S4C4F6_TOBAC|nr:PREDICTED: (E,E)-germacrene B synthase-like [Nicotiana tabacum]
MPKLAFVMAAEMRLFRNCDRFLAFAGSQQVAIATFAPRQNDENAGFSSYFHKLSTLKSLEVKKLARAYFKEAQWLNAGYIPTCEEYIKNAIVKKLARAYFKEAQWLNAGYIPTCEEYIKNAIVSNTFMALGTLSLIGMEELITKNIFEWITSEPSIVRASSTICRLMDDISDHEVQQQRGHVASIIECFIKEYGALKEEAYVKFRKEVKNSWKDINKALLRPTEVPTFVLERVLNLAHSMDTHFQDEEDGYTDSTSKSKDVITLLLVEPVNI